MSSNPLTLRRETLAKFLPTLEAIVAFENLFQQVNETAPAVNDDINASIASLYTRLASQQSELIARLDVVISELTIRRGVDEKARADINLIKHYLGI